MASDSVMASVKATAKKWQLELSDDDVKEYTDLVEDMIGKMRTLETIDQVLPELKKPREPGYRPPPEENPYNAWYYKTDIHGASSGKLAGKRLAIKDNVCVAGVPMMDGSRLFEGFTPSRDATVVTRILQAGGTITGKAVCEDLCLSASSFTCATGPVLNPNDVTRASGGSSSGSAVLVRCGDVDMAIGGDQGGSIRMPASWTGTVGLKPTFGLVPCTGAIGISFHLDHLGPIANNVKDCALLLEVIAGPDGLDPRQDSSRCSISYTDKLRADVTGLKVGLLTDAFAKCSPEVSAKVQDAVTELKKAGASVVDVAIPHFDQAGVFLLSIAYLGGYENMFKANFQSPVTGGFQDLDVYDHVATHLQDRMKTLYSSCHMPCMLAEALSDEERLRLLCSAQNGAQLLRQEYDAVLETCDVIIMPTMTTVAPKLPAEDIGITEKFMNYLADKSVMTEQMNLTHHPALSIPAGDADGLPVGMMIVGKHYDEQTVLNVAYAYECLRDLK